MASLFRPTVVQYWLRDCWIGADGQPCPKDAPGARFAKSRKVPKGTPGAKKVKKKASKWYARIPGQPRTVPLSANKVAAQQMLAERVKKAELAKAGIVDDFEANRTRPLLCPLCSSRGKKADGAPCDCPNGSHLSDYRRGMEAKEKEARYVSQAVAHCLAVFEGTGARFIGDLDANKVETWLADLRRDTGVGLSTSNHYLTSAKGFTRWLTRTRPPRWHSDPLACLAKLNEDTDVRRQRRDLDAGEAVRLLETTRASTRLSWHLTGQDRYFLYTVAFQSGLRAGELGSLTPASFVLDADHPFIRLQAKRSKRRKTDLQPIPQELADVLRPWLATKPADRPVWPGNWKRRAWQMMAKDLANARQGWLAEAGDDPAERKRREESDYLTYRDAEGRTFDFHATRHSYITLLAKSGVHPKMAQDLARHSTIDLTMNHYTHLRLHDQAAALKSLPSLLPSPPKTESPALARTGTDAPVCTRFAQTIDSGRDGLRLVETEAHPEPKVVAVREPANLQGFEATCGSVRRDETEAKEGTESMLGQIRSLSHAHLKQVWQ